MNSKMCLLCISAHEWESMGNPGWGFKNVLPLFKRSERIDVGDLKGDDTHGHDGEICVSTGPRSKLGDKLREAILGSGFSFDNDGSQRDDGSFGYTLQNTCGGLRYSTAEGFVRPAMRDGMHVLTNTFVRRVIFNDVKEATGIEVEKDGTKFTILANREVILSGGAMNSPTMLMLSGIGPKEELAKAKVADHLLVEMKEGVKSQIYIDVLNLHVNARGTLTLNSSDLFGRPIIHYQYLQDPTDTEVLKMGLFSDNRFVFRKSIC